MIRPTQVLAWLIVLAALGLLAFAWLAWSSVTVATVGAEAAQLEIEQLRLALGSRAPLLQADASGRLVRAPRAPAENTRRLKKLRVVAYRAPEKQVIRAEVPFWFARLKDPAIRLFLRGTGVDLKRLGVSAADLQRAGPGLIVDHTADNGDRFIVWTE